MKRFMLGVILFFSGAAHAGGAGQGNITSIEFLSAGRMLFRHDGARADPPGCVGANFASRWAIDASTEGGKAQWSGLLTAYALGKTIAIRGTRHCSVWGDTETAKDFRTIS